MRKSRRRKDCDDDCVDKDEGDANRRQLNRNYHRKKASTPNENSIFQNTLELVYGNLFTIHSTTLRYRLRSPKTRKIIHRMKFSLIQQRVNDTHCFRSTISIRLISFVPFKVEQ